MVFMEDVKSTKTSASKIKPSRIQINEIVYPIISKRTESFCKKYCQGNQYKFACTLPENNYLPPSSKQGDAPLCEWGNASYAWMLEDLTNQSRLESFRGENGASITTYFQHIANSVPFRERWKDWRFRNRVHIPACVREIHQLAPTIFLGLYNQKSLPDIAQQLKLNTHFVSNMADKVMVTLTKNRKLHLLLPKKEVSLTGFGDNDNDSDSGNEHQGHIRDDSYNIVKEQEKDIIREAWKKLSCVEQFVLEEMLINEEDAYDVLESLEAMNISIKPGVLPENTNRQQLFYFRRKAIKKLAKIAGLK